ncbi:MAG: hypothetical protein M3P51_13170 [Chloroflexota bacterium]|nr:hypothetical protein [Chloroflexota bacterium]
MIVKKANSILHAIDKARERQPLVEARHARPGDFWVAGTSSAYLVEVRDGKAICTGSWKGPCPGFEHTGCCYHAAVVALAVGLFTEAHEDALRGTVAA